MGWPPFLVLVHVVSKVCLCSLWFSSPSAARGSGKEWKETREWEWREALWEPPGRRVRANGNPGRRVSRCLVEAVGRGLDEPEWMWEAPPRFGRAHKSLVGEKEKEQGKVFRTRNFNGILWNSGCLASVVVVVPPVPFRLWFTSRHTRIYSLVG